MAGDVKQYVRTSIKAKVSTDMHTICQCESYQLPVKNHKP